MMRSASSLLSFLLLVSGLAVLSTPVAAQTLAPSQVHARRAAVLLAAPERRRSTRSLKRRLDADGLERRSPREALPKKDDDADPSTGGSTSADDSDDGFAVKAVKETWGATTKGADMALDASTEVLGSGYRGTKRIGGKVADAVSTIYNDVAGSFKKSSSPSLSGGDDPANASKKKHLSSLGGSASSDNLDDELAKTTKTKAGGSSLEDKPTGHDKHDKDKSETGASAPPHHSLREAGGPPHHDQAHHARRRSMPSIARRAEGKSRLPMDY